MLPPIFAGRSTTVCLTHPTHSPPHHPNPPHPPPEAEATPTSPPEQPARGLDPRGAKARTTGCPGQAPGMANGRCHMHGGKSTGARTAAGIARMTAANTTHGKYAAAGAARRTRRRYVRTVITRNRLKCDAVLLWSY